jgi:hypothetical protein
MTEQIEVQSDDVAQVWKDAHRQRAEDLSIWLKHFSWRLPEPDRPNGNFASPGRVVAAS